MAKSAYTCTYLPEHNFMVITCGVYLYNTYNRKVLVCHATHASWKQWTIPKGLKGENEEPLIAAFRELNEETGVDYKKLNIVAVYSLPPVKYQKQNKVLQSFLVVTDTNLDNYRFHCHNIPEDTFPEIDKWEWVAPDDLHKWLHESQQKNLPMIRELINA